MTSPVEIFKTVLENGNWINFREISGSEREVPGILILNKQDKRRYIDHGIHLTPERYSPDYTFTGGKIPAPKNIFLELYGKREAVADALLEDLEDIIEASSYDIALLDILELDFRNRYRYEMTVRILI